MSAAPRQRPVWVALPILIVAALVIAIAVVAFTAATEDTGEPSAPGPTPTVTVTEPAATGTVPSVCLDALDAADAMSSEAGAVIGASGDALGEVPLLITALLNDDVTALEGILTRVEVANDRLGASDLDVLAGRYSDLRDECRQGTA